MKRTLLALSIQCALLTTLTAQAREVNSDALINEMVANDQSLRQQQNDLTNKINELQEYTRNQHNNYDAAIESLISENDKLITINQNVMSEIEKLNKGVVATNQGITSNKQQITSLSQATTQKVNAIQGTLDKQVSSFNTYVEQGKLMNLAGLLAALGALIAAFWLSHRQKRKTEKLKTEVERVLNQIQSNTDNAMLRWSEQQSDTLNIWKRDFQSEMRDLIQQNIKTNTQEHIASLTEAANASIEAEKANLATEKAKIEALAMDAAMNQQSQHGQTEALNLSQFNRSDSTQSQTTTDNNAAEQLNNEKMYAGSDTLNQLDSVMNTDLTDNETDITESVAALSPADSKSNQSLSESVSSEDMLAQLDAVSATYEQEDYISDETTNDAKLDSDEESTLAVIEEEQDSTEQAMMTTGEFDSIDIDDMDTTITTEIVDLDDINSLDDELEQVEDEVDLSDLSNTSEFEEAEKVANETLDVNLPKDSNNEVLITENANDATTAVHQDHAPDVFENNSDAAKENKVEHEETSTALVSELHDESVITESVTDTTEELVLEDKDLFDTEDDEAVSDEVTALLDADEALTDDEDALSLDDMFAEDDIEDEFEAFEDEDNDETLIELDAITDESIETVINETVTTPSVVQTEVTTQTNISETASNSFLNAVVTDKATDTQLTEASTKLDDNKPYVNSNIDEEVIELPDAKELFEKANSLEKQGSQSDALETYDELIRNHEFDEHENTVRLVGVALDKKAKLLLSKNKVNDAITAYDRIISRYDNAQNTTEKHMVSEAILNSTLLELIYTGSINGSKVGTARTVFKNSPENLLAVEMLEVLRLSARKDVSASQDLLQQRFDGVELINMDWHSLESWAQSLNSRAKPRVLDSISFFKKWNDGREPIRYS